MRIVKLEVSNIKRIKAVEITPKGNVVVIGGRNAQGKSSLLDAIMYGLGGRSTMPDQPLRAGERQGKVVCTLAQAMDDIGLAVTRKVTSSGGSLVVTNAEGTKLPTPQAILDRLTGKLTFDPLAFTRDSAKGQLDTLKALVGVDFTEQDAARQAAYDSRTAVNREIKTLQGQIQGLPKHPDAPTEEVSLSALADKLEAARDANRKRRAIQIERDRLDAVVEGLRENIFRAEQKIAAWRAEAEKVQADIASSTELLADSKDIDPTPIIQQMTTAESTNKKVRDNQNRAAISRRLVALTAESAKITESIEAIDEQKNKTIEAAKLPIKGLVFGDEGVLYNNIPFGQCSSAEQLRISVAIGLAMNPELKILLIRDGSLLDADSMRLVTEMAEEAGGQVWVEVVSEGSECQVVIEDGMIKDDTI